MSGPKRKRKRKGNMGMRKHRKCGKGPKNRHTLQETARQMNEQQEQKKRPPAQQMFETVEELMRAEK